MTIQDAIETIKYDLTEKYAYTEIGEALNIAIRILESLGSLKKQIADVKRSIKSENCDYLTGYICALSAVEGMIAEIELGENNGQRT